MGEAVAIQSKRGKTALINGEVIPEVVKNLYVPQTITHNSPKSINQVIDEPREEVS